MSDGPDKSPSQLRPLLGPAVPPAGLRRLNKVPLLVALGAGASILVAIAYTVQQRSTRRAIGGDEAQQTQPAESASPRDFLAKERGAGPRGPVPLVKKPDLVGFGKAGAAGAGGPAAGKASREEENMRREEEAARHARVQAEANARNAITSVTREEEAHDKKKEQEPTPGRVAGGRGGPSMQEIMKAAGGRGDKDKEFNQQSEKKAFYEEGMRATPSVDHYLKATRMVPLSATEVKQGTVIPAVLISGVNSDLPGQLLAQVAENVYDTATGKFLLIPQGSKLVGVYSSSVSAGQERVLVAWTRIIYPDASSVDLGGMPGADQAGYAGFNDQVNNHLWRIFGHAALLSVMTAGVQLSQPQRTDGTISPESLIAGSLGMQMSQVGMELARRNMMIQPTLEIRPGYRFVVSLTKDIILPPWNG